jgi:hypothetical protein
METATAQLHKQSPDCADWQSRYVTFYPAFAVSLADIEAILEILEES